MFSNNNQISRRQTFRLFTFDLMGISLLIVPAYLARNSGVWGILSIVFGILLGLGYIGLLYWLSRRFPGDLLEGIKTGLPTWGKDLILFWLVFHCVLIAGFGGFVFGDLMKESLIPDQSYILILIILFLVAGYAVSGGIESRGRVYEIAFWFVLIPLAIMLFFAGREMQAEHFVPAEKFQWNMLFSGGYLVFMMETPLFFGAFFRKYLPSGEKKKGIFSCMLPALLLSGAFLLVEYVVLLGNFGGKSLASMSYPAVTLMNTVQFSGSFVKRLDALMLGVWFFTLFALLNLFLFHGAEFLKALTEPQEEKKKEKRLYLVTVLVMAAVLALIFAYLPKTREWFYGYIWYVGTPLTVLIPVILGIWKGRQK